MSYVTVKIPKSLSNVIDQLVDDKIQGYRIRSEFVIEAIRILLRDNKIVKQEVTATCVFRPSP